MRDKKVKTLGKTCAIIGNQINHKGIGEEKGGI